MAKLVTDPRAITNMWATDFTGLSNFELSITPTTATFSDSAGDKVVFRGTGIGLGSIGFPVTHSITGYTLTLQGIAAQTVTGLNLGRGELEAMLSGITSPNETMFRGKDVIIGGNFSDKLDGFAGNDELYGGNGADALYGGLGSDALYGGADSDGLAGGLGRDTLYGGDGDDYLTGGSGRDILFGGRGADTFRFEMVSDTPTGAANRDKIMDFSKGDKISVQYMDSIIAGPSAGTWDQFTYIGKAAFHGVVGELHYQIVDKPGKANDMTIVSGDTNGDKVADFEIELAGVHRLTIKDFDL